LWLSPRHALLIDGVLVPVELLINRLNLGRSSERVEFVRLRDLSPRAEERDREGVGAAVEERLSTPLPTTACSARALAGYGGASRCAR
jgi:hypothetical protein